MTKQYFAFGSNLDLAQLRARCPSAEVAGIAVLKGYKLCFPRTSQKRNCGVASIEVTPSAVVWGAVYRLAPEDLARLDGHEGYRPDRTADQNPYNRVTVTVDLQGIATEVETYLATPQPSPLLPNAAYVAQILRGARLHGFPDGYIAELEAIPTS